MVFFLVLANVGETPGRIVRSIVGVNTVATKGGRIPMHTSVEAHNDFGDIVLTAGEERILSVNSMNKNGSSFLVPVWSQEKFDWKGRTKRIENDLNGKPTLFRERYVDQEIFINGHFLYADSSGSLRRTAFLRKLAPERQTFYRVPEEPDLDYAD